MGTKMTHGVGVPKVIWGEGGVPGCFTSRGTFERRPHSEHPLPWPARSSVTVQAGLTSPHHSLLHHPAPGTLAFLLFLKPAKLVPTSEPFRFPFLLPGNLFLQISAWLASSPHSGLCSNVHSSGRRCPPPHTAPPLPCLGPPVYSTT